MKDKIGCFFYLSFYVLEILLFILVILYIGVYVFECKGCEI